MKKALLIIRITIVFFILLFIINIIYSLKDYHPINSKKISNNLFAIKTDIVNLFIITDGDTAICIDTGINIKKLNSELLKLNINLENIQAVFLTHSDKDHTEGLKLFKNAKIYLSEDESQMINNNKPRLFGLLKNTMPIKSYILLKEGSNIIINNIKIRAISTPGHTTGSMSYLINDNILFTGDILGLKKGKIINSPKLFAMNKKNSKDSIKKISLLTNISFICTSHYGISNNFDYAIKDLLK